MDQLFTLIDERLGYSVFREIEKTKREFSNTDKPVFSYNENGISITEEVGFGDYCDVSLKETDQIFKCLDKCFEKANVEYNDIDLICLTGGTAKMRQVKKALELRFGADKINEHDNFQSVIKGLSDQAFKLYFAKA